MLAVTVDIEDWYHVSSIAGSPFSMFSGVDEFFKRWNQCYDYVIELAKRVLDILGRLEGHATFFVVADMVQT